MTTIGIIGGTGLDRLDLLADREEHTVDTPYGVPAAPLVHGRVESRSFVFLGRHGHEHTLAPHEINYRANLWALREAGVDEIVAVAAVGGIDGSPEPGGLAVPDQLIDYTTGRTGTFFEGDGVAVEHIDFTWPYTPAVRDRILAAGRAAGIALVDGGCYAATQGPRLETAAEVRRLERDGCTLVGMTGMPEAALARELDLPYACCAVVANRAAGKGDGEISLEEIGMNLASGMKQIRQLVTVLARG
jgi:5'-deoxy-5'-methylthioadenosine phosphorylase